jgi:raffinose/stachyose/melibiose transport system permease protein
MSELALRRARHEPRRRIRIRAGDVLRFVVVLAIALIWLVPIAFALLTAFKSSDEIFTKPPYALPHALEWSNFSEAWKEANFRQFGLNSLIVTSIKVPLGIILSAFAAYAFSRFRFRFRKAVFFWLLIGAMIPVQIALIPMFDLLLRLHLINSYVGLLLPYLAFGFPIEVFLLYSFFNQIPRELDEAAKIDGATSFGILVRIILPLSAPILAALFILDFVATWNEFQIALVVMQSNEKFTLPVGLLYFQGHFSGDYTLATAAAIMASVPALIIYILFQRFFVAGLTAGAVKG